MLSMKRLRSVVHSIAHHSVSGLCYVHPHLGRACQEFGLDRSEINLLNESAKSRFEESSSEIAGGANALREKFTTILRSEMISPGDLSEARALFFFAQDGWPNGCHVRVVSTSGRSMDVAVDQLGNPTKFVDG